MVEHIEILNMEIIKEAKDLMNDRFPMMVQYFLEDTQMYLLEIEKAVNEKNAEIAVSPAHTIKSSARQLGAEKVSEVARAIEEQCRESVESGNLDFKTFEARYKQLKEEIAVATPELNKLC